MTEQQARNLMQRLQWKLWVEMSKFFITQPPNLVHWVAEY